MTITPKIIFPSSYIYSDEPPLETELHFRQIIALWQSLEELWSTRNDFYVAGNLTIYYSLKEKKSEDFRGPDLFIVLGTERKTRFSWVVWEEDNKYPNVIIEVLSPTTASIDKKEKKEIYQNTFRTPNYFWFDPISLELAGFHLVDSYYKPLLPNEQGHLWSEELGLYLGVNERVLRFFTPVGELIPTLSEAKQAETLRASQAEQIALEEAQKASQAEQRALEEMGKAQLAQEKTERIAAKLRELNIDPDTF